MATSDDDRGLTIYSADNLPAPSSPDLAKQLKTIQGDYLRRTGAIEAHHRSAGHAIDRQTTLADFGHERYTTAVESMVNRFEAVQRSPMAQEPLDQFTRRQIEDTGRHVRATVDGAARQMVEQVTRPYDTAPPRRRGVIARLLGD